MPTAIDARTAVRAIVLVGEKRSAATPPSTAASSTTPGAPKRFISGSSRRHPDAAPIKSAAYTMFTCFLRRVIASEITAPPVKKGSAASR